MVVKTCRRQGNKNGHVTAREYVGGRGCCRKPSGRSASYVGLGPPRVTRTPLDTYPHRAHSRLRLIALVGAAPRPPAYTPPGRRPPGFLLGSLRWSWGGWYSSPAVSLRSRFLDRRSQTSHRVQLQPLRKVQVLLLRVIHLLLLKFDLPRLFFGISRHSLASEKPLLSNRQCVA